MTASIFGLMNFFEGYVKNYRSFNLHQSDNISKFTRKEIDFFANLGEKLGFFTFIEDSKHDKSIKRSRPMDLSWWKSDERVDKENFVELILHLERESIRKKDTETIDKLFSKTEKEFVPKCVVAIQYVGNKERIDFLNELVTKINREQKSQVLMIYRYEDKYEKVEKVCAYSFNENGLLNSELRKAVCFIDQTGYWTMTFEEEFYLKQ